MPFNRPCKAINFGLYSLLAITPSGCTTYLSASKIENFSTTSKGQVYYLPKSEYQVNVSRELTACLLGYSDKSKEALAWLSTQFTAVRISIPDSIEVFNSILQDPAMQDKGIRPIIDSHLGQNWDKELVSVNKKTGQKQILDNDIGYLIEKIDSLNLKPELVIETEVSAKIDARSTQDLSQAYSIDYALMSSGLKATDYAVKTYPSGIIKSVNVAIDDQSGAAISNIIIGATKLAAATGGFPLTAGIANAGRGDFQSFSDWQRDQKRSSPGCKPDIRWKLYQRDTLKAESESNAEALVARKKEVDRLEEVQISAIAIHNKAAAALKELDANDPSRATAEALASKADADVKLATKKTQEEKVKLTTLTQASSKTETRFNSIRKSLTLMSSSTFRPTASQLREKLPGEVEALRSWLSTDSLKDCDSNLKCATDHLLPIINSLEVNAEVYAPSIPSKVTTKINNKNKKEETIEATGIYYRQPIKATLLVCKSQSCTLSGSVTATPENILVSELVDIPQLGALAVLPLKNWPFQNNTIQASFTEDGALTEVAYKSNAAAAKAAEVFESSADSISAFREAKRNQETLKLEASASELAAKKKLIDAQLEYEKSEAALVKFRESNSSENNE